MELTLNEATKTINNRFFPSEQSLENRILNFLENGVDSLDIFKKIKNHPNVHQIGRFLYNSGLDRTLFKFAIRKLKKNKPVPWTYVLKLFIKYKIIPKVDLEQTMFHHFLKKEAQQSEALFACKEWGDIFPKFQQLRSVYLQEMEQKNLSEESELLDQLAFVQAQNLIQEEEEIISKLLFINPKKEKYKQALQELNEKKALLTIQEEKKNISQLDRFENYMVVKKSLLKKDWLKIIFQQAKENPQRNKNLSLFLYFCDSPAQALNVLEMHVEKLSDYWFYLDWALETQQYTKGLELINHFFLNVKESAMFFLPLIYIKSQMLYALGKKTEAIDYLTAISQVQPDYKSVQYLLDKWTQKI